MKVNFVASWRSDAEGFGSGIGSCRRSGYDRYHIVKVKE